MSRDGEKGARGRIASLHRNPSGDRSQSSRQRQAGGNALPGGRIAKRLHDGVGPQWTFEAATHRESDSQYFCALHDIPRGQPEVVVQTRKQFPQSSASHPEPHGSLCVEAHAFHERASGLRHALRSSGQSFSLTQEMSVADIGTATGSGRHFVVGIACVAALSVVAGHPAAASTEKSAMRAEKSGRFLMASARRRCGSRRARTHRSRGASP